MEKLEELMKRHQNDSPQLSSMNLKQENEISVYKGILTTPAVIKNIAKIKKSFPTLPIGFYEVFTERLKANNFCDERLKDAVNHVIENCIYPTPTIAQFLTWDRRIEVFTYEQMLKKWDDGMGESYETIQFPDREKPVWVHVNDIKMYNLK
jgi:hypothetical protein